MKKWIEDWLYSVVTLLLFPLAPMVVSWINKGELTCNDFILTVGIYIISLGANSTNRIVLALGMIIAFILSGVSGKINVNTQNTLFVFGWTILIVFHIYFWIELFYKSRKNRSSSAEVEEVTKKAIEALKSYQEN